MHCLIVDDVHPILIDRLRENGVLVDYQPGFRLESDRALLGHCDILVIRSNFFVDAEVLAQSPKLQIIGRAGAGLDTIDVQAAEKAGVTILHAAEGNADAVAEHTLGLLLGLLSKIGSADVSVRIGEWKREFFRGLELKHRTVGIIGYGNMGSAVAARLAGFGCKVLAYDKYLDALPDGNAIQVDLEVLQQEADIISLHIPLTPETKGWIDTQFYRKCRKGVILLNTSRGSIVPVRDLVQELESGWLGGAGLDVLQHEPPASAGQEFSSLYERLFMRSDVLLTPHVAGWSLESYEKISMVLANKILSVLSIKAL